VNIANCKANPKNKQIPLTQASVSFHAGDAEYTLHFRNPVTFGMPSKVIPQGGAPTTLLVIIPLSTGYCISGASCPSTPPCPPVTEGGGDDGDPFEITIGSDAGKIKTKKKKPYAKAAVKRAADVKAKATKGKAKPAPKKKAAVKAKGKAKPKPAAKTKKKR
jgi:hypothetical protein